MKEFCDKERIKWEFVDKKDPHTLLWGTSLFIGSEEYISDNVFRSTKLARNYVARYFLDHIDNQGYNFQKLTLREKEKDIIYKYSQPNNNINNNRNFDLYNNSYIDENKSVNKLDLQKLTLKREINEICIIDLESVPYFNTQPKNNQLLIGFIEELHATYNKYNKWNGYIVAINSGHNDCVDHLLSSYCYPLILWLEQVNYRQIETIAIVSRDKAGRCTIDCLKHFLAMRNIMIKNIIIRNS